MATIDTAPVRKTSESSASSTGIDSTDPGPKSAETPSPELCAQKTSMVAGANPLGPVGTLTTLQVKALQVQIAFSMTNNLYTAVDSYNRVGKYQFQTRSLVNYGYIKEDYYKLFGQTGESAAVQIAAAWSGKDNISSLTDFLAAEDLQESMMFKITEENYSSLVRNSGIRTGDKPGTVMGMLFVAHVSDAAAAKTWRDTGTGNDISGEPLGLYYSLGRYAGVVLSAPTGII